MSITHSPVKPQNLGDVPDGGGYIKPTASQLSKLKADGNFFGDVFESTGNTKIIDSLGRFINTVTDGTPLFDLDPTGAAGSLENVLIFGAGGRIFLSDQTLNFTNTPGTEIIGRGIKVYESNSKYAKMAYEGGNAVIEVVGGVITGGKIRTADESNTANQAIVMDGATNTLKFYKANRLHAIDYSILLDDNLETYETSGGFISNPGLKVQEGIVLVVQGIHSSGYTYGVEVRYRGAGDPATSPYTGMGVRPDIDTDGYNWYKIEKREFAAGIYVQLLNGSEDINGTQYGAKLYYYGEKLKDGGTAIGVYAEGDGGISDGGIAIWAGYFVGDVSIEQDLYVFGEILVDGTTVIDSNRNITGVNINATGSYQMDGSDIINTSKEQTTNLKTRQYLAFGYDATITANNNTVTRGMHGVDGAYNGRGYRMTRAGKITAASIQFDAHNNEPSYSWYVRILIYKNGVNQLTIETNYEDDDDGDLGFVGNANISFSAGDSLMAVVQLEEESYEDIDIDNILVLLDILS